MRKTVGLLFLVSFFLMGCAKNNSEKKVIIYTSSDENEMAVINEMLGNKFPEYDITLEYLSTGSMAAKLKAEGTKTESDIVYDLEYGYMETLDKLGTFAKLDTYDFNIFLDELVVSKNYVPTLRYGGAIVVNTKLLHEKNLSMPQNYEDLLKKEYKETISMPNPKASGTGYMFYKSLVNAWGEKEALDYFSKLSTNILQFTSSGSGPVNFLIKEEVAIGFGMTSHAALKISEGHPLEILIFKEGSPYQACGAAIINGKEKRKSVQAVFRYFYEEITPTICKTLYPEQIYNGIIVDMDNYPKNITYADMKNNTPEEKENLLEKWMY